MVVLPIPFQLHTKRCDGFSPAPTAPGGALLYLLPPLGWGLQGSSQQNCDFAQCSSSCSSPPSVGWMASADGWGFARTLAPLPTLGHALAVYFPPPLRGGDQIRACSPLRPALGRVLEARCCFCSSEQCSFFNHSFFFFFFPAAVQCSCLRYSPQPWSADSCLASSPCVCLGISPSPPAFTGLNLVHTLLKALPFFLAPSLLYQGRFELRPCLPMQWWSRGSSPAGGEVDCGHSELCTDSGCSRGRLSHCPFL